MLTNSKIYHEIRPEANLKVDLAELWQYRDLFYYLIWRNLKVRYKQTVLGVLWVIFQPLITMVILSFFLGKLARVPSDGIPYPIFIFTGLIYWNYFSTAMLSTSTSLLENESLVKKVYFPRLIIPITNALTPLVDFTVTVVVLFGLMWFYRYHFYLRGVLFIPLLTLIVFLMATGGGLILASWNTRYRDVKYLTGFFIQILFYLSPIVYPASIIPAKFQWLLYLNPLAGVLTIAKQSLLKNNTLSWALLGVSVVAGLVLILAGSYYFRKSEKLMVDVL